ncbi:nuclear transport factor 2 family protein [Pengzhenrongella sp.]|jgi:hypothetical protein|uniref:nuclear transport factor 2 family protein n=1 Tax=Pengzhenrongella sp. TaxID=2888820 RepID=UPI002F945F0F
MNEATLRTILCELSRAFEARDLEGLLTSFSRSPTATYSGSEGGETATGAGALRPLFARLLRREATYSFDLPHLTYGGTHELVWMFGDGRGVEIRPGHADQVFPYRITGALVREDARWRWALLAGSEPTAPAADS